MMRILVVAFVACSAHPPARTPPRASLTASVRTGVDELVIDYTIENTGTVAIGAFLYPARPFPPPPTPADGAYIIFTALDAATIGLAPEFTPEAAVLAMVNHRPAPAPQYSGAVRLSPGDRRAGTVHVPLPLVYTTNDDVDIRPQATPTTRGTIRSMHFEIAIMDWRDLKIVDAFADGVHVDPQLQYDKRTQTSNVGYAETDVEVNIAGEVPPPAFRRVPRYWIIENE